MLCAMISPLATPAQSAPPVPKVTGTASMPFALSGTPSRHDDVGRYVRKRSKGKDGNRDLGLRHCKRRDRKRDRCDRDARPEPPSACWNNHLTSPSVGFCRPPPAFKRHDVGSSAAFWEFSISAAMRRETAAKAAGSLRRTPDMAISSLIAARPASTMMRSAISMASSIWCVIRTQVLPSCLTSERKSKRSVRDVTWSSWLKLSSSRTRAGLITRARASDTRWRIPPDS